MVVNSAMPKENAPKVRMSTIDNSGGILEFANIGRTQEINSISVLRLIMTIDFD